jgi:hypothetical protein
MKRLTAPWVEGTGLASGSSTTVRWGRVRRARVGPTATQAVRQERFQRRNVPEEASGEAFQPRNTGAATTSSATCMGARTQAGHPAKPRGAALVASGAAAETSGVTRSGSAGRGSTCLLQQPPPPRRPHPAVRASCSARLWWTAPPSNQGPPPAEFAPPPPPAESPSMERALRPSRARPSSAN